MNLEPDTRVETDRLFAALKEGGKVEWAPAEMPWGGYWGSLIDRFGNEWMFSCPAKLAASLSAAERRDALPALSQVRT